MKKFSETILLRKTHLEPFFTGTEKLTLTNEHIVVRFSKPGLTLFIIILNHEASTIEPFFMRRHMTQIFISQLNSTWCSELKRAFWNKDFIWKDIFEYGQGFKLKVY